MGDVNLEIKLSNLDERVTKIEDSGGGGESYISSVTTDFNVVNKKLSLSSLVTEKIQNLDSNGKLAYSNITSKPTTLSGYGITDAYTKSEVDDLIDGVTTDWETLEDKPFNTVGSDFNVSGNELQLSSANKNAIGKVENKADKTLVYGVVGTESWLYSKGYNKGDIVVFQDSSLEYSLYECLEGNINYPPAHYSAYWKKINIIDDLIDSTVKTSTVDSDGKTVTFTNIDTSKCYTPYADLGTSFTDIKPVGMESMTLNGTTLTYVLTNASAGMQIKLREIKL